MIVIFLATGVRHRLEEIELEDDRIGWTFCALRTAILGGRLRRGTPITDCPRCFA